MKVIARRCLIKDQEFVLIKDSHVTNGKRFEYIATIPYSELKNGRLIRTLNCVEMCVERIDACLAKGSDPILEAIKTRERDIDLKEFLKTNPSESEIFDFIANQEY